MTEIEWECFTDLDLVESVKNSNVYAGRQLKSDHNYFLPDGQLVQVRGGFSFVDGVQVRIRRDGSIHRTE